MCEEGGGWMCRREGKEGFVRGEKRMDELEGKRRMCIYDCK